MQPQLPTPEMSAVYQEIVEAKSNIDAMNKVINDARKQLAQQIQDIQASGGYNELLAKQAEATEKLAKLMEEANTKLLRFGNELAYLDVQEKPLQVSFSYKEKLDLLLARFKAAKKFLDNAVDTAKQEAAKTTQTVKRVVQYPFRQKSSLRAVAMPIEGIAAIMTGVNQFISGIDEAQQELQQLELDLGV